MNKDIHNDDELFRNAYRHFEDEPSAEVWNRVVADLNGRDVKHFRKMSARWKRTSYLLILLLGMVATYSGFYFLKKQDKTKPAAGSGAYKAPTDTGSNQAIARHSLQPNNQSDAVPLQPPVAKNTLPAADKANEQSGTEHADNQAVVKRTTPGQPITIENNASIQNINEKKIYAAATRTKDSVSGRTGTATNEGQLSTVPQQTIADDRKQHFAPVQDMAVDGRKNDVAKAADKTSEENGSNAAISTNRTIPTTNGYKLATQEVLPEIFGSKISPDILSKTTVDSAITQQLAANKYKPTLQQKGGGAAKEEDTAAQQHRPEAANHFKPWFAITGFVSSDFAEYRLDNDGPASGGNRHEDRREIRDRENHGFSFSAGVLASLQATPKLSFKSGISYSGTVINIHPQTLYASPDGNQHIAYKLVTSSGYTYVKSTRSPAPAAGDSIHADAALHRTHYLSVPLMAGYTIFANRYFTIIPSAGIAANFLLNTQVQTSLNFTGVKEPVVINNLNGSKSFYASFVADAALQYHLFRRVDVVLLPAFRYALSPVTHNTAVKTYPFNFSLGAGVKIRL